MFQRMGGAPKVALERLAQATANKGYMFFRRYNSERIGTKAQDK